MPVNENKRNWVFGQAKQIIANGRTGQDVRSVDLTGPLLNAFVSALVAMKEIRDDISTLDADFYISMFLAHQIANDLPEGTAPSVAISEVLTNERIEYWAENVWTWVQSIPRNYTYYVPLAGVGPFGASNLQIGNSLELVDTNALESVHDLPVIPIDKYRTNSNSKRASQLQKDIRYLCIEATGYHSAGFTRESAPARAISRLKQFLVLARAVSVLETTWTPPGDYPEVAMRATSFEANGCSIPNPNATKRLPFCTPASVLRPSLEKTRSMAIPICLMSVLQRCWLIECLS